MFISVSIPVLEDLGKAFSKHILNELAPRAYLWLVRSVNLFALLSWGCVLDVFTTLTDSFQYVPSDHDSFAACRSPERPRIILLHMTRLANGRKSTDV